VKKLFILTKLKFKRAEKTIPNHCRIVLCKSSSSAKTFNYKALFTIDCYLPKTKPFFCLSCEKHCRLFIFNGATKNDFPPDKRLIIENEVLKVPVFCVVECQKESPTRAISRKAQIFSSQMIHYTWWSFAFPFFSFLFKIQWSISRGWNDEQEA
jgi:hypothetical protein